MDQPENIWLPKRMHLDKQHNKNYNMKCLPQCYNYSSNYPLSLFKQAKSRNICPLDREF